MGNLIEQLLRGFVELFIIQFLLKVSKTSFSDLQETQYENVSILKILDYKFIEKFRYFFWNQAFSRFVTPGM